MAGASAAMGWPLVAVCTMGTASPILLASLCFALCAPPLPPLLTPTKVLQPAPTTTPLCATPTWQVGDTVCC